MSGIWREEGGGGLDGSRRPTGLTSRPLWTILAGAAVVLALAACSSAVPEGGDPWSASYAENDGRVWAAIHTTLDALGYVVEEEDRSDGRIRAAQISDRPYEGVVLRIDQVREAEVVHVHVRPSGGAAVPVGDHRGRNQAVQEFLSELDRRLERSSVR
jgi:uncharacterized lipoprotein